MKIQKLAPLDYQITEPWVQKKWMPVIQHGTGMEFEYVLGQQIRTTDMNHLLR